MRLGDYFSWRNDLAHREIGIEVEMEGPYLPSEIRGWSVKGDGSLRGNGLEYILPNPVSRNLFEERISRLYDAFLSQPHQIDPSDRCGVHIHLNCRDLEIDEIFNFITLYLVVEDVLMHWCGDNREGNLFCLRARDAEWMIRMLIQDKKYGIFDTVTHNETFKYGSLNLAALARYGSLEFRGLETPKTPHRIITWIKLLLALKDYAIATRHSSDLISGVCIKTPRVFLTEILGKELFDEIKCRNISDMMVEGARRVQALAYIPLGKIPKKERWNVEQAPAGVTLTGNTFRFNVTSDTVVWGNPPPGVLTSEEFPVEFDTQEEEF